jgi:RimJ/RimL family protein N-acetyltransferase
MSVRIILETSRLTLREFRPEDADAFARIICDAETMRFYPLPFHRKDADLWIGRNLRRYEQNGHGLWAIESKSTGELVGDCGMTFQQVDSEVLPEIGYHLRRDQWGNGYATEAAQACRDYGFTRLQKDALISLIRPENVSSCRVALRNGMTIWKETTHAGLRHCVYRITRAEWAAPDHK